MFVYVPVVQSTTFASVFWIVLSIVGPAAVWPADETSVSAMPSTELLLHEPPPLDDAVRDELHEYVARRRPELAEV